MEMGEKLLSYICDFAKSHNAWTKYSGLAVIEIIHIVVNCIVCFQIINIPPSPQWAIISLGLCITIWIIWALWTKRIFFRDGWLSIIWVTLIILVSICFATIIYPRFLVGTLLDSPYTQVIGSILCASICLFLLLFIESKLIKRKNLLILFAVNNVSETNYQNVNDSIKYACDKIQSHCNDVEFSILSFDIRKDIKAYYRYLCSPLVQADALIYMSIIENKGDYQFTNISSRVNPSRIPQNDTYDKRYLASIIDWHGKYCSWNVLNESKDKLASKIQIGNNIQGMVMMYVLCLYLIKNELNKVLPFARSMYEMYEPESPLIKEHVDALIANAYMTSAYNQECATKDYKLAFQQLEECRNYFSFIENNKSYIESMARLLFYIGDIDRSKIYTNKMRSFDDWGYNLNCGFYAIINNKTNEFISAYKKIYDDTEIIGQIVHFRAGLRVVPQTNKTAPNREQVNFAISFLQQQMEIDKDQKRKILYQYAIAFLYQYINIKKAKVLLRKDHDSTLFNNTENTKLNQFKNRILKREEKLPMS